MYKLRKMRSRKVLYNVSMEYKQKLKQIINVSHQEVITQGET